jgi:hypothetical protein
MLTFQRAHPRELLHVEVLFRLPAPDSDLFLLLRLAEPGFDPLQQLAHPRLLRCGIQHWLPKCPHQLQFYKKYIVEMYIFYIMICFKFLYV